VNGSCPAAAHPSVWSRQLEADFVFKHVRWRIHLDVQGPPQGHTHCRAVGAVFGFSGMAFLPGCFPSSSVARRPKAIPRAATLTDGAELKHANRTFFDARKAILNERSLLALAADCLSQPASPGS